MISEEPNSPKTCPKCGGYGYVRIALDEVTACDCVHGLCYQLDHQRDRILLLTAGSTDEDLDNVDAIDRELITYASLRVRIELAEILDQDSWRICPTTKIIRERIDKLAREPVR